MLNFSHRYSLKRRFQSVLSVLVSDKANQGALLKLMESVVNSDLNLITDNSSKNSSENISTESKAIILGLYYHQDLAVLSSYFTDSECSPEYLTVALAIALICRGEMQPRSFISKISNYLQPYPDFCSQLDFAHNLANQGASRAIAASVIPKNSLAFGIFCFLSTPYSWNLVNQAAGDFQVSISAIAGAYLASRSNNIGANNLGNELGDHLLAAWTGVYDLSNIPNDFYPSVRFPQRMSLGV